MQSESEKHLLAELSERELELVEWLLPKDRPFYADALSSLKKLPVVFRDREGTITLGDFDEASAEVIAVGTIESEQRHRASISMNPDHDGALLHLPIVDNASSRWTLSTWMPGSSHFGAVREIAISDTNGELQYTFALSASERVLWLHHAKSQYNQLIPVTGVFVELARQLPQFKTDRLTHEGFFALAEHASDAMIEQALLDYNKRARKFDASNIAAQNSRSNGLRGVIDRIGKRS